MKFNNQVAVITGAASGIGLAIAKKLLSEGANVAILDLNKEVLAATYTGYENQSQFFGIDITVQSAVLEGIKKHCRNMGPY